MPLYILLNCNTSDVLLMESARVIDDSVFYFDTAMLRPLGVNLNEPEIEIIIPSSRPRRLDADESGFLEALLAW